MMTQANNQSQPIELADAIRNISSMIGQGATCADVSAAAVQCSATMLPGARAVAYEVQSGGDSLRVLAAANASFVSVGESLRLSDTSILSRALAEPFRVHTEAYSDANQFFPTAGGFPGEPDEVLSAKAVPRTDDQSIVLLVVSDPDTAKEANRVLMTLSELLIALCAGRDAALINDQSAFDVARAKQEWERTVDALPEVVCLVDQNGDIVRANRTLERWDLGKVNAVAGTHVHSLFHPNCKTATCSLRDAVSLTMAAQASHGYLESAITDNELGRTLIVHTRLMPDLPMQSHEDSHPCAVVVVSDVSALQKAQQDLSNLNKGLEERVRIRTRELEDSNRDLEEEVARRRAAERDLQASRDELADLSQQLLIAQEEERRKLSRELHDSLGQSLGAVKYSLERVAAMHDNPGHGDPADELIGIVDNIGSLIQETRSMALSLRPPVLDDIGTASAVGWLCQNFAETYAEIALHIEIDVPNAEIPDALATPVYRIVQEALNNVVKHAEADTVLVALRLDEEILRLEVLDDGIGFSGNVEDTASFKKLGKIGRLGMRERALNSNGQMTVESWPGDGTKVTAEWPLATVRANTE